MKKTSAEMIKKIENSIITYLSENPQRTRKETIDGALEIYGEKKKNNDPDSTYNLVRSLIGTKINEMLNEKDIISKDKKLSLKKDGLVIVKESKCRQQVLVCLKQSPASFDNLNSSLQKFFDTDKTASKKDDEMLRILLQSTLDKMKSSKEIIYESNKYALPSVEEKTSYPKTAIPEEKFEKVFLDRLCNNGGPFFEKFVASLLEKYYIITGKDVQSVEVCGGSDDGGIDVIIDTLDDLGFVEHVLVQAKCRKTIQVTEKEVREFFGAMNVEKGSRGIYITTSSFHPCAMKLLLSIPNCVGIDGNKIFNIVKKTAYGIKKNKDGYLFDDRIFDD